MRGSSDGWASVVRRASPVSFRGFFVEAPDPKKTNYSYSYSYAYSPRVPLAYATAACDPGQAHGPVRAVGRRHVVLSSQPSEPHVVGV